MKEGLLVSAVPAEDTRVPVQISRQSLHHLPGGLMGPLATPVTASETATTRAEEKSRGGGQERNLQGRSVT